MHQSPRAIECSARRESQVVEARVDRTEPERVTLLPIEEVQDT